MAATAVHRLTLDPRPCKEIPVFPVSDRPYFVAPTLIIFQQIKKKGIFIFGHGKMDFQTFICPWASKFQLLK
jgi:hypothetical protein